MIVAVGTILKSVVQDENSYKIESWKYRELYHKDVNPHYDIGLIRLSKDISFTKNVQPVMLAETDTTKVRDVVTLIGFGKFEVSNSKDFICFLIKIFLFLYTF